MAACSQRCADRRQATTTCRVRRAVIVDTSALLAYFDTDEPDHAAVTTIVETATGAFGCLAIRRSRARYLVASRLGVSAELQCSGELASGAWIWPRSAPRTWQGHTRRRALRRPVDRPCRRVDRHPRRPLSDANRRNPRSQALRGRSAIDAAASRSCVARVTNAVGELD